MSFVKKIFILCILIFFIEFCSNPNPLSNLFPESTDKRSLTSSGLQSGATVPDFVFYNTDGTTETLSHLLTIKRGVVIYFTMWCPFCDIEMKDIRNNVKPLYPNVEFYLLDYVSDTVAHAHDNQVATNYTDFKAAFDQNSILTGLFAGTMGSTIVIDKNFILLMNENYKDGQRLLQALNALP